MMFNTNRNRSTFSKIFIFIFTLSCLHSFALSPSSPSDTPAALDESTDKPLTVAESSEYTATSLYSDVMDFIHTLQTRSNHIKVEKLCTSTEGRWVPLLILGDPLPSSPLDFRFDGRLPVYIQANIHAGEVEGKEASLMFARDLIWDGPSDLFEHIVLLIAPIFNADGNEKLSPDNRRSQNGPESVGIRYNGQNLDLNRDAMIVESPEVRGLLEKVLNRWDPVLFIDCHTTNGSPHEEPVTYVWGFNPNGDLGIIEYMRSKMMPDVQKHLKKNYKVLSIPYGNFQDYENPEKGWEPSGPQPRYITNYISLRNRMAILNENYTYADFKTRVQGCYYFLKSVIEFCSDHHEEIGTLIAEADRKTVQRGTSPQPTDSMAITYHVRPLKDKVIIRGYEMEVSPRESGWPRVRKTDRKRTYHVPYYCDFYPDRSIRIPFGYFIPAGENVIIEKLKQHGIVVEELIRPVTAHVETFHLKELKSNERLYQGHHLNSVKGEYKTSEQDFPEGTVFVGLNQKLANVASYLLEPESDDGLLVWNFLDRHLVAQWRRTLQPVPIYRVIEPVKLVKRVLTNL